MVKYRAQRLRERAEGQELLSTLPHSLTTTARSSLRPSGYRGHHSYRCVRVTRYWGQSGAGKVGQSCFVLAWGKRDPSSSWHSSRVSVTSGHWIHLSGRTAASQHQYPCLWGNFCPMNLRITPTNWEKSLPFPVREEGWVVEGVNDFCQG